MSRIAILPARGGSKRIPRKNVRMFHGRPMLAWPVEAALASGAFDRVIVSTDDPEIAAVARDCGAEVPFVRPPELANDHATAIAVVRHAIAAMGELGDPPDLACLIYATAPFVAPGDLRRGLELLEGRPDKAYALSVTSFPFPIQRALRLTPEGAIDAMQPEHRLTRSQDLEPAFHDAAQFAWGRAQAWLGGEILFSPATLPVMIPRWRVQDIDTEEDWERAERLFAVVRGPTGA